MQTGKTLLAWWVAKSRHKPSQETPYLVTRVEVWLVYEMQMQQMLSLWLHNNLIDIQVNSSMATTAIGHKVRILVEFLAKLLALDQHLQVEIQPQRIKLNEFTNNLFTFVLIN